MSSENTNLAKIERLAAVKGMYDLLPPNSRRWRLVEEESHKLLRAYGYSEIRTPMVEYTQLFNRSIGEETDIVEKEMYTFLDRDERSLTMRPEGTAGAVRAYVEHALHKTEPITQWYYLGPMFRHERAQRGRYRQFYQLGAEVLGVANPGIDAEMIAMLVDLLSRLELPSLQVHLNTLGCPECRPAYRAALLEYLSPKASHLCEDCQRRYRENPLRVLDCKIEGCKEIAASAPTSLDKTCAACRTHWEGVLADLQLLKVPYEVNHRLVRGLDYYTRTTFEVLSFGGELGSQNTLAGGGRYDGLVAELGGPPTPAVGFAMGMERLMLALGEDKPKLGPAAQITLVLQEPRGRAAALHLMAQLRQLNISVDFDHRGGSMKSQMKRADRRSSHLVLILGENEFANGTIMVREMQSSQQQEIPLSEAINKLPLLLEKVS